MGTPGLPLFNFSAVAIATDDFSEHNKLGKGGFGPVYKVTTTRCHLFDNYLSYFMLEKEMDFLHFSKRGSYRGGKKLLLRGSQGNHVKASRNLRMSSH